MTHPDDNDGEARFSAALDAIGKALAELHDIGEMLAVLAAIHHTVMSSYCGPDDYAEEMRLFGEQTARVSAAIERRRQEAAPRATH